MTLDADISAAGFEPLGDAHVGGTSVVYRARRRATGDIVAVKVHDRVDPARLDREVAIGRSVQHPRLVVPVETCALVDGRHVSIAPWVDGVPLAGLLRSGAHVTERQALVIVDDAVGALAALHRNGVVHRDVSPANLLVTADGRAVLIDVGLGRSADDVTVTAAGDLAGTPRYLAPELIRGERATPAADQYAVALVAFELLAGRPPFPETLTAATALHHHLHRSPTPLDEIEPTVNPAVADAIERALAKDPGDRWPDIEAFGAAMRRSELPGDSGVRRRAVAAGVGIVVASAAAVGFAAIGDGPDDEDAATTDTVATEPSPTTSGPATTTTAGASAARNRRWRPASTSSQRPSRPS